ncbi:MAG: hypothetical protein IJ960_01960 [Oscillospiraceae bacterium]|nr:hypothetical protein [Oscillospiraceae bacterium]
MAKKQELVVNKMYEWELEVDGQTVMWKCFVGEDECITYEGDRECKHLKIMDKTQERGVLQIDCVTRVWDEIVPFQLENGIPYIKLKDDEGEAKWVSSDTTKEDRLQAQIRKVKREAYGSWTTGGIFVLMCVVQLIVQGTLGEWPIFPTLAVLCVVAGFMNMIRLKNELEQLGRPFSWKL